MIKNIIIFGSVLIGLGVWALLTFQIPRSLDQQPVRRVLDKPLAVGLVGGGFSLDVSGDQGMLPRKETGLVLYVRYMDIELYQTIASCRNAASGNLLGTGMYEGYCDNDIYLMELSDNIVTVTIASVNMPGEIITQIVLPEGVSWYSHRDVQNKIRKEKKLQKEAAEVAREKLEALLVNNCKVWFDGCNTCTRKEPGGNKSCTEMVCVEQNVSYCKVPFDSRNWMH